MDVTIGMDSPVLLLLKDDGATSSNGEFLLIYVFGFNINRIGKRKPGKSWRKSTPHMN